MQEDLVDRPVFYLLFQYVFGNARFYWPEAAGTLIGLVVSSLLLYLLLTTLYRSKSHDDQDRGGP